MPPDFNKPWFIPGPMTDALKEAFARIEVLENRVRELEKSLENDGK